MVRKKALKDELERAYKFRERVLKIIPELKNEIEYKNSEINRLKNEKEYYYNNINEIENNLNEKIKEIEGLELQLNEANKKISNLAERLFNLHSDWHVEGGLAWRLNPKTKKAEKYKVPKKFDVDKVDNKDFDEETQMVKFSYKENKKSNYGVDYEIPISLYTFMGGKLFLPPVKKKDDINYFITIDDLKKKIVEKGRSIQGKYINAMLQFCIDKQEKIFTSIEFRKKCNIPTRQTGDYYLKKLINWDLIIKVKKGIYKCKNMSKLS
jgi:hypothetical protein